MTVRRAGNGPVPGPRGPRVRRGPDNLPVADVLAGIAFVAVAIASLAFLTGGLPNGAAGGGDGGPIRTATPSNIVVVDPRTNVPGTILYVKAGNIWLQHGAKATTLTSGGNDSMASFSADGQWIYFIRTVAQAGLWKINAVPRRFDLETPALMRVRTDGSTPPEQLLSGGLSSGAYNWSFFLRQPVVSPNGKTIVVVTDGPDPNTGDVVLKQFDPATGSLTPLNAPEIPPLGHQDPTWSPDGRYLLFVKNARDGFRGAPVVMRFDTETGKFVAITGPGYTAPRWSPDGRYIVATRTTTFGTDVIVLDAVLGTELLRVTSDERSFDPVWSPAGNALAYFSLDRGVTDLWQVGLSTTLEPALVGVPLKLTLLAGLDPASRPDWWIPADQLPTPPPTQAPTAPPTPVSSGSGATSPTTVP